MGFCRTAAMSDVSSVKGIRCVAVRYVLYSFSASSTSLLVSQVSVLTILLQTCGFKHLSQISLGI